MTRNQHWKPKTRWYDLEIIVAFWLFIASVAFTYWAASEYFKECL